jgi:hypothetical protein
MVKDGWAMGVSGVSVLSDGDVVTCGGGVKTFEEGESETVDEGEFVVCSLSVRLGLDEAAVGSGCLVVRLGIGLCLLNCNKIHAKMELNEA